MVRITLPDNSVREYEGAVTADVVAADIGARLAKDAYGARIDGVLSDVMTPIRKDAAIEIVTLRNDPAASLELIRHSCAHVMAEAICMLFPETQLVYGPTVENGFYYDIDLERPLSTEDFTAIEEQMAAIIKEDRPFVRYEVGCEKALERLRTEGNRYKIENAERADGEVISFYVTGELNQGHFEDLCRGPHVPRTGRIGAFKVLSVAGAYFHGDASQKMLQRVYGTAFATNKELQAYLDQLEEAKKRDHRILGRQLGLFHVDDAVGQGLILWKPAGAVIRQELQDFISEELNKQGYSQVFTPHIGKLELYKRSGHFPYYQESQYPPLIHHETLSQMASEGQSCAELSNRMGSGQIDGYLLKPMNCPHHIRIYASDPHSYRDLPVRLAEFGTVYRWEQSGEIGGLTRVRGFTQDDAHIFCTEGQLLDELRGCLGLVKLVLETLAITDFRVRVGLRDEDDGKYVGDRANWQKAQQACLEAAESLGVDYSRERGEAAFYGPKIDFVVKDVVGRQWQLGTVQVDYNLPERFDLSYSGEDNKPHRPVMIHRAPFGSMERLVGVLIEHYEGSFPLWLSPEQARVMAISEKSNEYARNVYNRLKESNLRCKIDLSDDKIGAKIRRAHEQKVPYMVVVGPSEQEGETVNLRIRGCRQQRQVKPAEFAREVEQCVIERRFELAFGDND